MIRSVLGKAVTTGANVLDRLGERLHGEEYDEEESEEEEEEEDELEHESDPKVAELKEGNRALKRSVRDLKKALKSERATAKEASEKLSAAVSDAATIDDLVEEYSKLSNEAAAQAERDASKLATALNRNEELTTKLQSYEAQILSLTDAEATEVRELVASGALANDGARLFAALRAAKARQFELELDLNDAKNRLKRNACPESCTLEEASQVKLGQVSPSSNSNTKEEKEEEEEARQQALSQLDCKNDQIIQSLEARAVVAEAALEDSRRRLNELETQLKSKEDTKIQSIKTLERELETANTSLQDALKAKAELESRLNAANADKEKQFRDMEDRAKSEARAIFTHQVLAIQAERDQALIKAQTERSKRRQVHNKLMEARGNIRVYCRCRPSRDLEPSAAKFNSDDTITILRDEKFTDPISFEYDGVFSPESTQQHVFDTAAKDLVISALDGFSVCIFAYGQTGSGKTYTMTGPEKDRGLNFRAIQMLFTLAEEAAAEHSVDYTLHLSILEIYNETIKDLLPSSESNSKNTKKLEIHVASGECQVPGLERHTVNSVEDVEALLDRGAKHRSVGAHDMNDQSSRSHQIVTLHISGKTSTSTLNSKLHLVDLAGSERVAKTDAAGERLKEAQNINKSLSALGDVIAALSAASNSRNARHVPFRNSKLTFFLQDSLSGDSKALMFVNVSPAPSDVPETLCSLKFAARCRDTALGKAKKNSTPNSSAAHRDALSPDRSSNRRISSSSSTPSSSATKSSSHFSR